MWVCGCVGVCMREGGLCAVVCVSSTPIYSFGISHNCLLLAQSWRSAQLKTVTHTGTNIVILGQQGVALNYVLDCSMLPSEVGVLSCLLLPVRTGESVGRTGNEFKSVGQTGNEFESVGWTV